MKIVRNIFAVIIGYAIFVVSAVLLFQLSGIDAHADAANGIIALIIIYGLIFSFIGGFAAQKISKSHNLSINFILAGLMAGFAAFSLFKSPGNHYSQIAAIFLFAPASIVGGWTGLTSKK